MLSMRFAHPSTIGSLASKPLRALSGLLALLAALAVLTIGAPARADTSDPSTGDYDDDEEPADDEYADTDPSALSDFREPLAPYGTWSQDPTYGTVWVPNTTVVGSDFAPYQSAGHWSMTDDDEWLWVSDYDWGYIPFHYGRWVWVGSHWGWIPGRVYSPAWVSWRVGGGGYLGWAPLPPAYYWSDGLAVALWTVPYAAYCFVPTSHVFYSNVSTHVVRDRAVVQRVAQNTHAYRPATPSVGGKKNGAHSPGAAGARHRSSPSLSEAGVSPSAAPKSRMAPDSRSKAYSTRKSTAAVRRSLGAASGRNGFGSHAARSPGARQDGGARRADLPSRRDAWQGSRGAGDRQQAPSFHQPAARGAGGARSPQHFGPPSGGVGRPGAGSVSRPPSSPGRSPSFHAPGGRPSSPSMHAPAARPSAPSLHTPSRSAPKSVGRAVGGRRR